jgi:hypothetical protein
MGETGAATGIIESRRTLASGTSDSFDLMAMTRLLSFIAGAIVVAALYLLLT